MGDAAAKKTLKEKFWMGMLGGAIWGFDALLRASQSRAWKALMSRTTKETSEPKPEMPVEPVPVRTPTLKDLVQIRKKT